MEPGSIVLIYPTTKRKQKNIKWWPTDDNFTPHVIREIKRCPTSNKDVVYLEEGIIGYNSSGDELGIPMEFCNEVQTMEEGQVILRQIKHLI